MSYENFQVAAMLFYASLVIYEDFKGFTLRRFDISTAYAVLLVLTSISHLIGLNGWVDNKWFFRDSYSQELSGKAIFIFNLGSIILMETIRVVIKAKRIWDDESHIVGTISGLSFYYVFTVSIVLFTFTSFFSGIVSSLGSLGTFISLLVDGTVLLLSSIAHRTGKHRLLVLLYTLFLSVWALMFGYLRMEILIPILAYLLGDLLVSKSILKMHFFSKAIVVGSLIVFPPLFAYLGANREKLSGENKLRESVTSINKETDSEDQSIMSRLSIVPQVSQIIMLTEKKGFYEGQTLSYLGFVFVPRFLWPEKPLIMQGQWFALEIGAAYRTRTGRVNNSINMTVPGEFYLNFGFAGVIIGCLIFGLFIGSLWNRTSFDGILGWGFRFYLIFLGLFSLGADLQIIPSLIAYLLTYKAVSFLVTFFQKAR